MYPRTHEGTQTAARLSRPHHKRSRSQCPFCRVCPCDPSVTFPCRNTTRNGAVRFRGRSFVCITTSGWRWLRIGRWTSQILTCMITTTTGLIFSTVRVCANQPLGGSRWMADGNFSPFVFLDGMTPADGSISPDFFSDILPQNGDLLQRG